MPKKPFVKWYNRDMPLITLQYWHKGEYYGLKQLTEGTVYYNALFIYQKGRGVDIYYDVYDDDELTGFFKRFPKKFQKMSQEYERECKKMVRFAKKAKPKDFAKIFDWHVSSWPKLTAIFALGELVDENDKNKMARAALDLRTRTEKVEYISGNNFVKFAKQLLPDLKEYADFLTYQEIISQQLPSKRELTKRTKGYIYFDETVYTGLTIEEFAKLRNIEINQKAFRADLTPPHFIIGSVAAKGKVRGKAKIIMELDDLKKIKKGDILVTPMTTPDYLWAMHKAAAFVTDEGGITCHAAIVAREFKKPCIIGTKTATRILKDGDQIEVDADHGLVRILKK